MNSNYCVSKSAFLKSLIGFEKWFFRSNVQIYLLPTATINFLNLLLIFSFQTSIFSNLICENPSNFYCKICIILFSHNIILFSVQARTMVHEWIVVGCHACLLNTFSKWTEQLLYFSHILYANHWNLRFPDSSALKN